MTHPFIEKFQKMLAGTKGAIIHGPMSPVLLTIPWLRDALEPMNLLGINRGRESFFVVSERAYRGECIRGFREFTEGKVTLGALRERFNKLDARISAFYDRCGALDLRKLSDAEIETLVEETYEIFAQLANETIYIEIFDQDLLGEVLGAPGKKVIEEIWEQGTHPTFISFEGRRLRALLNFVKQKNHQSVLPIRYIYTDYIWPKPIAEIKKSLLEIESDFQIKEAECQKMEEVAAHHLVEFKKWIENLSDLSRKTVEYMQLMMELRDVRKDAIGKVQTIIADTAIELFVRAGIDPVHAPYIGLPELKRGITYLKENKEHIEKRSDGSISITYHDNRYEVDLCDYKETVDQYFALNTEKKEHFELKGQVAQRGKVTGRVRIVIDPQDDKGFEQGDILVTSMTRPEFVPLMKKAGAVITNEGGITCHAAIVSRELKIPCIIGTKTATQILKDGDMVEVDANTGIVKIL